MATKINGTLLSTKKKKKKTVKEELQDLEIDIKHFKSKKESRIEITFNKILKPYQRNRKSGYGDHLYDPLNSYKDYIQRRLKKILEEKNIEMIKEGSEIKINTIVEIQPPKSFSQLKTLYCLRQQILPVTKPDNDNYEKTIFDIMNKKVWYDDGNVVENTATKIYGYENKTYVFITYKDQLDVTGRISKEIKSKMTEKEIDFIFNKER